MQKKVITIFIVRRCKVATKGIDYCKNYAQQSYSLCIPSPELNCLLFLLSPDIGNHQLFDHPEWNTINRYDLLGLFKVQFILFVHSCNHLISSSYSISFTGLQTKLENNSWLLPGIRAKTLPLSLSSLIITSRSVALQHS